MSAHQPDVDCPNCGTPRHSDELDDCCMLDEKELAALRSERDALQKRVEESERQVALASTVRADKDDTIRKQLTQLAAVTKERDEARENYNVLQGRYAAMEQRATDAEKERDGWEQALDLETERLRERDAQLEAAEAREQTLRSELREVDAHLRQRLAEAEAREKRLREALERHGVHLQACDRRPHDPRPCSCGLSAALADAAPEGPEDCGCFGFHSCGSEDPSPVPFRPKPEGSGR